MSLGEQLAGRRPATVPVPLAVDPAGYAAAERAVAAAAEAVAQAQRAGDAAVARERLDRARAELTGQPVVVVELRTLPPVEWETLLDAHPPTDAQQGRGWRWNPATLRPALLAAVVVADDGDPVRDPAWWEAAARDGRVGPAELDLLTDTAAAMHLRAPQPAVGKG